MMIEVNLLPQELRRVEHTPLPRFLIIIAGTTLVSIVLALGAIVNLKTLPAMARADAALAEEMKAAAQSEREHGTLMGQIEEVKQRKRAIAEIWRARIIWSKKLEQLGSMLPRFVGLEKMTLENSPRTARDSEIGGCLSLESVCAGADVDRLAMLRRILRGDYPVKDNRDPWVGREWFGDFLSIEATPWVKKDMADYEEKEALKFTLKLAIKSDATRLKDYLEKSRQDEADKAKAAQTEKTTVAPASTQIPQTKTNPEGAPALGDASGRAGT
jgi:Tfp pilus assembly protein PilN